MSTSGSVDSPLDMFGGLVTDVSPPDLPPGVSPDCQDVKFFSGGVSTRPGLVNQFTAIAGTPTVNYLKTYVPPTGLLRLLLLDAAGAFWKESSPGTLSQIASGIVANSYGSSVTLFAREWLAISDGKYGVDLPRQYDDTNFDRVSQTGPGAAPSAIDEVSSATIGAAPTGLVQQSYLIVASPNGLSETGNIITVKLTSAIPSTWVQIGDVFSIISAGVAGYNVGYTVASISSDGLSLTAISNTVGLANSGGGSIALGVTLVSVPGGTYSTFAPLGGLIKISGAGSAAYNGTWTVRQAAAGGNSFYVYIPTLGLVASGGGTATAVGNITAGVHKLSVMFKTRQGYITAPAPPVSWTAAGGLRVVVSNIPVGPPNIIARILIFTLSGLNSFYYLSNMVINDNSTTSTIIDFSDSNLAAGTLADQNFKLVELGECAGVIDYGERLFWWGERAKVQNFNNLSFDGGFVPYGGGANPGLPLGWTADAANFGGGGQATTVVWGGGYNIYGTGSAICGRITQSAYQDAYGVAILQPNTGYSIRVRVIKEPASVNFTQGTLHIHLYSASASINTTGISLACTTFGTSYVEYSAVLTAPLPSIPSDLQLRVYLDGTPTNGAQISMDCIEVYPTNAPYNKSTVRASKSEDPESYDGVTGFLTVNQDDGFAVRSAFVIRNNLYFVKEHSIWVTQDDGTNEPSGWTIDEVSRKVGTVSVHGVDVGEDWAVIAERTGLYITWGGEPIKISQEIQPLWDTINWNYGYNIWVKVDLQNRRVLTGTPLVSNVYPNKILMLDYRMLRTPQEISDAGPIRVSYTGKLLAIDHSRKWAPWTIAANSANVVERFDGTQAVFIGNGAGNGKVYQLSETAGTDDGAALPSYYTTYFHFHHDQEQALQIGSHQKLFSYMAQFVEGSGSLAVYAVMPGGTIIIPIASLVLRNPGVEDMELPLNVTASRVAFKMVSGIGAGDWFRLTKFIINAAPSPSAPVRGFN